MKKLLLLFLLTTNSYAASWECVSRLVSCHTWRMEVPTGWIVSGDTITSDHSYAMTFIPDQQHTWKI